MKTTIDYSKSPAAKFDAVQDIKNYLGERYDQLVKDGIGRLPAHQFQVLLGFGGIEGFPVLAWYDHFHGDGAYKRDIEAWEAKCESQALNKKLRTGSD